LRLEQYLIGLAVKQMKNLGELRLKETLINEDLVRQRGGILLAS
jgi:hypothetical protein